MPVISIVIGAVAVPFCIMALAGSYQAHTEKKSEQSDRLAILAALFMTAAAIAWKGIL